jgi:tungstate transport system ATP-binding protein
MADAYQLNDIQFFYDKTLALSLSELNIQANKITALIGPNGCGKSTLLNLLAFLTTNQQGRINFFSEPATSNNKLSFSKRIAFLPQKPYLLRGTVEDNLNLALKFKNIQKNQSPTLIKSALKTLDITHLCQQHAYSLSEGELQKVALARAIITSPDVLLMDEPFSYLDHNSEQTVKHFIQYYVKKSNKTLVFSTHNRLQGLAIAGDTISLVKGKLIKTPLINLFHGTIINQLFDTGKIQIMLVDKSAGYQNVSINPDEIVLSKELLVSSMRNQFHGKVMAIIDEMGKIRISIQAGELFQVMITYQSLAELDISLGDLLWVNFNSNAIVAF